MAKQFWRCCAAWNRANASGCIDNFAEVIAVIVALSGYYGFDNTGDEAILLAITQELKRLGHIPVVLSNTPAATAAQYGVRAVARMQPLVLLSTLWQSDVLLSGGGGLLQDKTSRRTLQYYLALIRLARFFGKRVVVFNQSVGPLSSQGEQAVRQALASGVRAVLREQTSQHYLERLGVPAQLGGDPALLLAEGRSWPAPDPLRVVIAPRGGQRQSSERLVLVARELIARGHQLTLLSMQPGQDGPEIALFADLPGVTLKETNDPQQALALVASAGLVIGVRLHALILAAAVGTNFIGVSYDPKVAAFCADAGAPSFAADFSPADLLAASQQQPDWSAIAAMKTRARESFTFALQ
jgi:polysaccharide pyruvyl transferase CsaB